MRTAGVMVSIDSGQQAVAVRPPVMCLGGKATVAYAAGVAKCPVCRLIVNVSSYLINAHPPFAGYRRELTAEVVG